MYCSKCGKKLNEENKFCSHCGASVENNIAAPEKESPKPASKKKKIVFASVFAGILSLVLVVVLILAGKSPASREDICKEIAAYSNFEQYDFVIKDYSEIKRDTNKRNRYDRVWVEVIAENDSVALASSYTLCYNRYNSGWLLESIECTESDYHALENVTVPQVAADIQSAHKSLIDRYGLTNLSFKIEIPEQNIEEKTLLVVSNVLAENDDISGSAVIESIYRLNINDGWCLVGSTLKEYSYEAKTIPSKELIEQTTSQWNNDFELLTEGKVASNAYVLTYEEHDSTGFKDCTVVWQNTLIYEYDIDIGDWYLAGDNYRITNASPNVSGSWSYAVGEEYYELFVHQSDSDYIEYDLNYSIWPDNMLHVGIGYVSDSILNRSEEWTFEYSEDELCVIFKTVNPSFSFTYGGDFFTDEYYLYYKAYLAEISGMSGFYLNDKLLTRVDDFS